MLAYLRLLAKNRLAAFKGNGSGKKGKNAFLSVLKVIGIALASLLIYGSIVFLEYILFDLLNGMHQGHTVIGLALLGATMITLIYGFFQLSGTLFFSRDTSFLAALPLTSRTVFTVKLLSVIAGEAGVSLMFCTPLIICYGVAEGLGIGYYLKSLITFGLAPLIPLTVGTLLSFALIRISGLWKRREGVTTIFSVVLCMAIVLGELSLQSMSEDEIVRWMFSLVTGQRSLTQMLLRNLPWLQWGHEGILTAGGAGWLQTGLFVLVSVAVMALVILLLGGGYMKLAVRQGEAIGAVNRGRKRFKGRDGERSPLRALVMQEVRDVLSVPVYATNCLIGMLMMPVMMIGMMLSSAEMGIGQLSQLATLIPQGAFLAGATGVFALTGAMCEAASTAVSREGRTHELRKTYPVSGALQLQAKVYMGVLFHAAGVVLIAVVLCFLLPAFWLQILAAALCSVAMAFLFSLVGVILDAHRPKLNWKTETEAVKQNFNGMIAMLLSMVLVALLVGGYILLIKWDLGWYGAFAVVMALCLLLDILLMMWLNRRSGKAYLAH